jgi:arginine transport system substrate-binding protein
MGKKYYKQRIKVKRYMVVIIFIAMVGLFFYFKKDVLIQDSPIIVGMMSGWPPYMNINKQGEFEGFDVDIARELEKKINKKIEIIDLGSLESLLMALDKGKINILMSGLDITKRRKNLMDMAQYTTAKIDQCYLMFWGEPPIKKIDELRGSKKNVVCVEPGSEVVSFLDWPEYDYIKTKPIPGVIEMVLEIKFNKSDAIILEPAAAEDVLKKYPKVKYIKVDIPERLQIPGAGIGIRKGGKEMFDTIQKGIDAMKKDGSLEKLQKKWKIG